MAIDGGHGPSGAVYLSAGKAPPKPPPVARLGLTEVERALSVLDGRHPEHERLQRQTREAALQRRDQIAVELERNARSRKRRRIALAFGLLAGCAGAGIVGKLALRADKLRVAIGAAEGPWLARGFTPVASNALTGKRSLEVDLPGASCFVAVATSPAPVRVTSPEGNGLGPGSVAWCACGATHATIEAPDGAETGLSVLRTAAATLGGPLARSFLDFAPGGWAENAGEGGGACAEATLDAWIDAHTPASSTADPAVADAYDRAFAAHAARPALARAGLRPAALLDGARRFLVADVPAATCALALAATPDTALSLRARGGERLVAKARGALAWCGDPASVRTVWREGTAPVAVLEVPATRIGGVLGMREAAADAGLALPPSAAWISRDDLAFDAGALLRASGAADVVSAPLRVDPGPPDARVIALSLAPGANVVSEPEGVARSCNPPLAPSSAAQETWAVCAQSAPVSWFERADAAVGAARGALPVWLTVLEGHRELDAVARIPELLALTRRMVREGFEPVALEGVTELPDGVRVMGRAGEDAIVAVGLVPGRPWVLPYTDGIPWDLGDAPRVVKLAPGEVAKLTTSPAPALPPSARRTVVFRHPLL